MKKKELAHFRHYGIINKINIFLFLKNFYFIIAKTVELVYNRNSVKKFFKNFKKAIELNTLLWYNKNGTLFSKSKIEKKTKKKISK